MLEQCVIFTDLDGTLLDHHDYSWVPARDALNAAQRHNIPIIINTSKTRAEVSTLLVEMALEQQPYVVENGSAIVFPVMSFSLLDKLKEQPEYKLVDGEHIWVFGELRSSICNWLNTIKDQHGYQIESYQDWSTQTIIEKTGLSKSKAIESQKKEFSEPFQWFDTEEKFTQFKQQAEAQGYCILKGGRFYHLQGRVSKANVFDFFRRYQQALFPNAATLKLIALGDNHNDVDMLNQADLAVCIKSPVNDFPTITNPAVIYSKQFGPIGWNEEILTLLTHLKIYYPNLNTITRGPNG